jgi:hypothetical protein
LHTTISPARCGRGRRRGLTVLAGRGKNRVPAQNERAAQFHHRLPGPRPRDVVPLAGIPSLTGRPLGVRSCQRISWQVPPGNLATEVIPLRLLGKRRSTSTESRVHGTSGHFTGAIPCVTSAKEYREVIPHRRQPACKKGRKPGPPARIRHSGHLRSMVVQALELLAYIASYHRVFEGLCLKYVPISWRFF